MVEALLQAILSGLAVGGAYALVALGFSITFTTTKTLNFSPGSLINSASIPSLPQLRLAVDIRLLALRRRHWDLGLRPLLLTVF